MSAQTIADVLNAVASPVPRKRSFLPNAATASYNLSLASSLNPGAIAHKQALTSETKAFVAARLDVLAAGRDHEKLIFHHEKSTIDFVERHIYLGINVYRRASDLLAGDCLFCGSDVIAPDEITIRNSQLLNIHSPVWTAYVSCRDESGDHVERDFGPYTRDEIKDRLGIDCGDFYKDVIVLQKLSDEFNPTSETIFIRVE